MIKSYDDLEIEPKGLIVQRISDINIEYLKQLLNNNICLTVVGLFSLGLATSRDSLDLPSIDTLLEEIYALTKNYIQ